MSADPVLQLEGLSAGYDAAAVVRDLDLQVGAGEVVALLGPNGAGKTTTLRAISGLIHPMSGVIRVDGNDIGSTVAHCAGPSRHRPRAGRSRSVLRPHRRRAFRLGYRGDTSTPNIAYTLLPCLAAISERRAGLLSGGEQQMLTVGRALARRPRLLLLDELSLGLAPVIVQRLLPVVATYAKESGCAVLLVEQHIQIALAVADRGYVLSHGELVIHETAETLRADHRLILSGYLGEAVGVVTGRQRGLDARRRVSRRRTPPRRDHRGREARPWSARR